MHNIISTLTHLWERAGQLFSNAFGWAIALFAWYISWLGNEKAAVVLVVICVIWDMIWGVAASVKQKKFILSCLLRETFWKLVVYVGSLSIILFAERVIGIHFGVTIRILAVVAASVELFSSAGNILIIKPDFVFVRLFGKYLVGEIADKMHISEEAVKEMLGGSEKGRKTS